MTQLGYSASVTEKTLARLRELAYVDDEKFARAWAESRAARGAYGAERIARELQSKGVDPEVTRRAVGAALDLNSETENARRVLERRFGMEDLKNAKAFRRAAALLQRRGFAAEVIYSLLGRARDAD